MKHQDFFIDQIKSSIETIINREINLEEFSFVILPSNLRNEIPKSNLDEIIDMWIMPTKSEIRLTFTEVIETLTSREGYLPLWIKLLIVEQNIVLLNISNRFRKLKEIREHNSGNYIKKVETENAEDIVFTIEKERIALIRKLLWRFQLTEAEKEIFKNSELSIFEVELFFKNHFNKYTYFPPDYNHRHINNIDYSSLVIKKNDSEYKIIECIGTENEIIKFKSFDLSDIVNYYLKSEKNYCIDGLEIKL